MTAQRYSDYYNIRASFYSRVARKEHRCRICGRVIEPGETYSLKECTRHGVSLRLKDCYECRFDGIAGRVAFSGFVDEMDLVTVESALAWAKRYDLSPAAVYFMERVKTDD